MTQTLTELSIRVRQETKCNYLVSYHKAASLNLQNEVKQREGISSQGSRKQVEESVLKPDVLPACLEVLIVTCSQCLHTDIELHNTAHMTPEPLHSKVLTILRRHVISAKQS